MLYISWMSRPWKKETLKNKKEKEKFEEAMSSHIYLMEAITSDLK